jgi:transcriptional regulator with XRE-family HTH domain
VLIGTRLRQLREQKQMSQGDIEDRTGLSQCYVSRVEHGHIVPSLETLERFAGVLDVPLYQLLYSGEEVPATPSLMPPATMEAAMADNGDKGQDAQFLLKLRKLIAGMAEPDRDVLLNMAKRLAAR